MRLLLVEDERSIAKFIAQGLRETGYNVDVEHDGSSGLARALATDYDLLVLDILLPRMSGLDVLCELRREGLKLPVLLLTALDEVEARFGRRGR